MSDLTCTYPTEVATERAKETAALRAELERHRALVADLRAEANKSFLIPSHRLRIEMAGHLLRQHGFEEAD